MVPDFLAFVAKFILTLIGLKVLEATLVRKNPESATGQALAFLMG